MRTAQLVLRPLRNSDLAPLFEIQRDPVAIRHTTIATSADDAARWLHAWEAERLRRGFALCVRVERDTGGVVGWGGLGVDPFDPDRGRRSGTSSPPPSGAGAWRRNW